MVFFADKFILGLPCSRELIEKNRFLSIKIRFLIDSQLIQTPKFLGFDPARRLFRASPFKEFCVTLPERKRSGKVMDNGWSKVPGEEGVVGVVLQEPRARHVPARGHLHRVDRRRDCARLARRVSTTTRMSK